MTSNTTPTTATLETLNAQLRGRTLHRVNDKSTTIHAVLWDSQRGNGCFLLEGEDGICVSLDRAEIDITGDVFTWARIAQQYRRRANALRQEAEEARRAGNSTRAEELRNEASWADMDGSRYTDFPLPRPTR